MFAQRIFWCGYQNPQDFFFLILRLLKCYLMLFHLNIIFCLSAHKILRNIWETLMERLCIPILYNENIFISKSTSTNAQLSDSSLRPLKVRKDFWKCMEIHEFFFSGFLHWECSIPAESVQKLLHVCLCQVQTKDVSTFPSITYEVCLISVYRLDLSKHNQKKKVILLEEKHVAKAATHTRGCFFFFYISIVRVPAFPTIGPDLPL